jgi:rSAM/selenodomain-associated transferase 2
LERSAAIRVSIVVPVLNEAAGITGFLKSLDCVRSDTEEVIVVDGGSTDETVTLATPCVSHVVRAPQGRASQLNAGAAVARGDVLLFLHADTQLPNGAISAIRHAVENGATWGRFDVRIAGTSPWLVLVGTLMNWRSRLTGIATGDQAIFVTCAALQAVGGVPEIALMEDIALSSLLKKRAKPTCLSLKVVTSGRRWEQHGVLRTIVLMWRLRLSYSLGADPNQLAQQYAHPPSIEL